MAPPSGRVRRGISSDWNRSRPEGLRGRDDDDRARGQDLRAAGLRCTAPRVRCCRTGGRVRALAGRRGRRRRAVSLGRVSTRAVYDVLGALGDAGLSPGGCSPLAAPPVRGPHHGARPRRVPVVRRHRRPPSRIAVALPAARRGRRFRGRGRRAHRLGRCATWVRGRDLRGSPPSSSPTPPHPDPPGVKPSHPSEPVHHRHQHRHRHRRRRPGRHHRGPVPVSGRQLHLYLKTHNYHWNVTGPMFQTLHPHVRGAAVQRARPRGRRDRRAHPGPGRLAPGATGREFAALSSVTETTTALEATEMVRRPVAAHETAGLHRPLGVPVVEAATTSPPPTCAHPAPPRCTRRLPGCSAASRLTVGRPAGPVDSGPRPSGSGGPAEGSPERVPVHGWAPLPAMSTSGSASASAGDLRTKRR